MSHSIKKRKQVELKDTYWVKSPKLPLFFPAEKDDGSLLSPLSYGSSRASQALLEQEEQEERTNTF